MRLQIYATKESEKISDLEKFKELNKEVKELCEGLVYEDKKNISEELLDVIQWCVNIANEYDINLERDCHKHHAKLLERGHQFVL